MSDLHQSVMYLYTYLLDGKFNKRCKQETGCSGTATVYNPVVQAKLHRASTTLTVSKHWSIIYRLPQCWLCCHVVAGGRCGRR